MSAPHIQPAEAMKKISDEGFTFVDVRTEAEFAAGHVPGAFNVPVSLPGPDGALAPNPEFVSVMSKAFPNDTPLVLGCKGGVRSARAGGLLLAAGFSNVLDQTQGWDGRDGTGWANAGLPVETGVPADRSYATAKSR